MQTLIEVLRKTTAYFQNKGIESARLDAELLFANVLNCKRLDLYLRFEEPLPDADLDRLRPLVKRRGQREPLQYILGTVPFLELTLKVGQCVLIPRPETEEWVDQFSRFCGWPPDKSAQPVGSEHPVTYPSPDAILDLGTGSGAIALALAKRFPDAQVVAVDTSVEALELARSNAELNALSERVEFVQSDWWESIQGRRFDWIVANPPYLTAAEWSSAEPEVRDFEPKSALVAADDGLADLKMILRGARYHLKDGGCIALETGIFQHAALHAIAPECMGANVAMRSVRDLNGFERVFVARLRH